MNTEIPTINTLFEQLGLDSTDVAIQHFLASQPPLPRHLPLHKANIWNHSQALFLQQAIEEDSEWSYLVDQLNARLR